MPCPLYNNNGCTCAGCSNFVKSTSIAVSGTVLQITIPNQPLRNGQKLCIALCQSIPDTITQTMQVQIIVDGTKLPVITPCGNYVYADQLRSRTVLKVNVATDTQFALVCRNSKLCCTSNGFPIIPVPAAATASTAAKA